MTGEVWQTVLAILASLGGGGLIVLALSSWLGKIWANRLMANHMHSQNQAIEDLKGKLARETERYRTRLRNAEFIFQREYEAASALVAIVTDLESKHADPWMDDPSAFYETMVGKLNATSLELARYLSRHAAIVPQDARRMLAEAQESATRGGFGEVAGNPLPREMAQECFEKLKAAEAILLTRLCDQASDTARTS